MISERRHKTHTIIAVLSNLNVSLKNIKQSFVTENAVAREFHYECKHKEWKFLPRQPMNAKRNRNAIVLAVKRSVLRSGDMVIRIV